jgi:hypothetical protein
VDQTSNFSKAQFSLLVLAATSCVVFWNRVGGSWQIVIGEFFFTTDLNLMLRKRESHLTHHPTALSIPYILKLKG